MNRLGKHSLNDCPLYFEFVPDFAALADLPLPSAHTVLLIVADSAGVPSNIVCNVAAHFFVVGLTYVCVWGPDCGRVHDIFDEIHVGDGSSEPQFAFMSTWHDDESLNKALFFFLRCAIPSEPELSSTSYVAVTVGRTDWRQLQCKTPSPAPTLSSLVLLADESQAEASSS